LKNVRLEISKLFESLKRDIHILISLLVDNNSVTIKEILEFVEEKQLMLLDERIRLRLKDIDAQPISDDSDNLEKLKKVLEAYFSCPAIQLWGYKTYIENESPYSIQHGIKGAEFERVLVILDDEESTHRQYSYEKLFDLIPPSNNDIKNQREGKPTIHDGTRRLFYVCCSRALKDLAVIFFVPDVTSALTKIKNAEIFENSNILSIDDIIPE